MLLTQDEIISNRRLSLLITILLVGNIVFFLFVKEISFRAASRETHDPLCMNISYEDKSITPGKTGESSSTVKNNKSGIASSESFMSGHLDNLIKSYQTTRQSPGDFSTDQEQAPGPESVNNAGTGSLNFSLTGRSLLSAPVLPSGSAEGTVIVEITVDKNGNVTEANPNGRGTTTSDPELKRRARECALTAKFSPAPLMSDQSGIITIVFDYTK